MQLVFTERLLHLSLDDRRKEYRRQDFISLDKILTWREKNRCKWGSVPFGMLKCVVAHIVVIFTGQSENQECYLSEKLGQPKYN